MPAFGTFVLTIGGEQQDGTAENKARLHLLPQGVDTLIDADADEFKFPSKFAKATGESISLPYSLTLFTDSTSGPSTTIGYEGYVATGNGGRVDFEIAAQEAGTTKALTDLTDEVIVPISTTQQYRDEAEAAADAAAATLLEMANTTPIVVTPQKFGALADGAANDTAAINAAIAALTPGSTLHFPPGRYKTDGGHVIATPAVKVQGSTGRGQTFNSSAQLYLRNGANADMLTIAANEVTVRDLTLHGQFADQTGASRGLVVNDGSNYLLLDAVWATSFNGDGMIFGQTTGTLSATVTNCESRLNQGYGMKFNGGGTDTIVSQTYIDQNTLSGVYLGTGDISLTECHIWSNGTGASGNRDGVTVVGASGCRLVNCYIETNTEGAGIRFSTGTMTGHQIIGCDIWRNGFQGITGFQPSNVTVSGCLIHHNNNKGQTGVTGSGISLNGAVGCIITGNQFYGPSPFNQTYAYFEQGACTGGIFANNVVGQHGVGDVVLTTAGAAPTIVRNNSGLTTLGPGETARSVAASNTVANNSTTFATVLSQPIVAGAKYVIRGALNVDGAQAADVKIRAQATSSTGATGWFGLGGNPTGSTTSTTATNMNPSNALAIAVSGGAGVTAGMVGVGTLQLLSVNGYVVGGSVDGTLDVQFAQVTADATDTTLRAGSTLELIRVA